MLAVFFSSCQKELLYDVSQINSLGLRIVFNPVADARSLLFNSTYTNPFNEPYTVKTFRFYISQVDLLNTDSAIVYQDSRSNYYLIDEADTATAFISLTVPSHRYNQLAFVVGVDSARNVSGAQSGALDPVNGMFWTWNSGYIMAKLEGSSPLSGAPDHRIQYHIGGFKEPYNTLVKVVLPLPGVQSSTFQAGKTSTIQVSANVNAWFHNPNDLHIAQTPVWMTPGDTSRKIAENYAHMFTATHVTGK